METHLVVIGDSQDRQSGLGRICGDLIERVKLHLVARSDNSHRPIDFLRPILYGGSAGDRMADSDSWGAQDLLGYVACTPHEDRIIVLTVYDPARCFGIADAVRQLRHFGKRNVQLWGYFAIDAEGPLKEGGFGGPAREALTAYDRILPYTGFGMQVLGATLRSLAAGEHLTKVSPPLPHGLADAWFEAPTEMDEPRRKLFEGWFAWVQEHRAANRKIIGIVAANQPRKDWGGVFIALGELAKIRDDFAVWAHTDRFITEAWCFPEMAEVSGLGERLLFTGGTANDKTLEGGGGLKDHELSWLYRQCAFTIAPGLGEGFGYPIVESQASGVPVVGVSYAGGRQFLSRQVPAMMTRAEGAYLLKRPVVGSWRAFINDELSHPSKPLDVSPLRWSTLWPAWERWFREGLEK